MSSFNINLSLALNEKKMYDFLLSEGDDTKDTFKQSINRIKSLKSLIKPYLPETSEALDIALEKLSLFVAKPSSKEAQEFFTMSQVFLSAFSELMSGLIDHVEEIETSDEDLEKTMKVVSKKKVDKIVDMHFTPSQYTMDKLKKGYNKIASLRESQEINEISLTAIKRFADKAADFLSKPISDSSGTTSALKKFFGGNIISKIIKRDLNNIKLNQFKELSNSISPHLEKLKSPIMPSPPTAATPSAPETTTTPSAPDSATRAKPSEKSSMTDKFKKGDRKSPDESIPSATLSGKDSKEKDGESPIKSKMSSIDFSSIRDVDFSGEDKIKLTKILSDEILASDDPEIKKIFGYENVNTKALAESIQNRRMLEHLNSRSLVFLLEDASSDQKIYDLIKKSLSKMGKDVSHDSIAIMTGGILKKKPEELKVSKPESKKAVEDPEAAKEKKTGDSPETPESSRDEEKKEPKAEESDKDKISLSSLFGPHYASDEDKKDIIDSLKKGEGIELKDTTGLLDSEQLEKLKKAILGIIDDKIVETKINGGNDIIERWNRLIGF